MNLATIQGKTVEYRTFFGVEVGIVYAALDDGTPAQWIVFPDRTLLQVDARGYECLDDAQAATVARWRLRRINKGIDKPEGPAKTKHDLFEEVRIEADSETVTDECGAEGKYGAKCYRQRGHELGLTTHARAHIGPVKAGGPDAVYVDDGKEDMEIWTTEKLPEVFH